MADSGDIAKAGTARKGTRRALDGESRGLRDPESITWCLGNPKLVGHRFTPHQRMVLQIAWGEWSAYRTSEYVAIRMDGDPASVREARHEAEKLA